MTLENALSTERLGKYISWASGDDNRALELYALNVAISEAFYTSLHILEITLRNSIHDAITRSYGEDWFSNRDNILDAYQIKKIAEATSKFKNPPSDGQIVAELTFGFWTSMFGRSKYLLWGRCFHQIFDAGEPVKRKQVATRFDQVRKLRNRIAHHEPIIQKDLEIIHTEIRELIGWLSVDALTWCDSYCRFSQVHPNQQIIIGNLRNPRL